MAARRGSKARQADQGPASITSALPQIYSNIEELHSVRIEAMRTKGAMDRDDMEYLFDAMPIIKEYCTEQDRVLATTGPESCPDEAPEHRASKKARPMARYAKIHGGSNMGTLCLRYLESTLDPTQLQHMAVRRALAATVKESSDADVLCKRCNIAFIVVAAESDMVCPECGEARMFIDSELGLTYDQEVKRSTLPQFQYKRSNHYNEALSQLQAKQTTVIPDEVLNAIKAEFKKNRLTSIGDITLPKVRAFLKKLGYTKYYEHTSYIAKLLGVEPPKIDDALEARLKTMFLQIQTPFSKHCPSNRSNFCSYSYILHKLSQLLDRDDLAQHFPLLKSRQKLIAHDALWKKICEELGWQFVRSV